MTIINGSLLGDIVKFHKPEHQANTAAIVIDEMNKAWACETDENCLVRKQSQQETLRFCKDLGCRIIVVHEKEEKQIKHLYDLIKKPDFSCVKQSFGLLDAKNEPPLLPFLKERKITSLVLMGGHYSICVRESLIGRHSFLRSSGLLNHQITVLTSPALLAGYKPEMYQLEPKFSADACSFKNKDADFVLDKQWPIFALHKGMRIYTKISD